MLTRHSRVLISTGYVVPRVLYRAWRQQHNPAVSTLAAEDGVDTSHRLDPTLGQHQTCRLYPLTNKGREGLDKVKDMLFAELFERSSR